MTPVRSVNILPDEIIEIHFELPSKKKGDLGRLITVEESWNILLALKDTRKSTVFERFEVLIGVTMKLPACGM